jgi:phosphatidylserine decarboxylase
VDTADEPTRTAEIYQKWITFKNALASPPSPSVDEDPLSRDIDFSDDDSSPEDDIPAADKGSQKANKKKGKSKKDHDSSYRLQGESDVMGVIFLEISRITDLPPEKNGEG